MMQQYDPLDFGLQERKMLIRFYRTQLLSNNSLIRICNYGYNAFLKQGILTIYSVFRLNQRPFQIKKKGKGQLLQEKQIQLQLLVQQGLFFFLNGYEEYQRQYIRQKRLYVFQSLSKQPQIIVKDDTRFIRGWKSVWKFENPEVMQQELFSQVQGRLRISLIKKIQELTKVKWLILSNYWTPGQRKSQQLKNRMQEKYQNMSLFQLVTGQQQGQYAETIQNQFAMPKQLVSKMLKKLQI